MKAKHYPKSLLRMTAIAVLLWVSSPLKAADPPTPDRFTISGIITDKHSGETLIGANVLEQRNKQGTATNAYGHYSITLPEGEVSLRYSYLGYRTVEHSFVLRRDTTIHVPMSDANLLQEVVVVSDRKEAGNIATGMGAMEVPMAQIKQTPNMLGEADVMKAIQLIPGVQSGTEGTAGLHVRGGGPDQNLILLDGVPVYNVDHLFGFFSVFTPEAVKKVTLFKGSFPARFGGRLSSVVDVRTNDGDMQHYHGLFSIGLLSSKINVEGPISKGKTSFNFSARRSYFDLLAKPFMPKDEQLGYYFYDLNAKINHRFSDRSRLFLSIYNGRDRFYSKYEESWDSGNATSIDRGKMDWGNTIVSARWNFLFGPRLFSNTTIAYNKYHLGLSSSTKEQRTMKTQGANSHYEMSYRSGIQDWSLQTDFDFNPTPQHHIKFGANYLYHSFRPEVATTRISERNKGQLVQDTTYNNQNNQVIYGHEASAYVEDNISLGENLRMNLGLHASLFHVQKKTYYSLQPRFSVRYQFAEHSSLKAAYTQMTQYVHLLSSTPISMPTDLWVPITKNIKPMQAHQYSLGAYHTGIQGWEFSIEGYYKHMNNVLEYKDGTSFLGSSTGWEEKVEMGKGRSMGIELMVQKTMGRTTGWVSYTLAKSDRIFENGTVNNGERFPYRYDRRHSINLVLSHRLSKKVNLNASWVFFTGATTTIPKEETAILLPGGGAESSNDAHYIEETSYITHRNNYRLPSSHRLNVGVDFNLKTRRGTSVWNISVYNLYNAMNPTFVYRSWDNKGNRKVVKKLTMLPLIPSVTYTYKF